MERLGCDGHGYALVFTLASRKAGCAAMETAPTLQMGKVGPQGSGCSQLLGTKAELCISGGGGARDPDLTQKPLQRDPKLQVFPPTSPSPQKGKRKRRKKLT